MKQSVAKYETAGPARAAQADDDIHLVKMWLFGKSDHTKEAYFRDIKAFAEFTNKELRQIRIHDIHAWLELLSSRDFATSTIARKLASVKSLFTFGQKIGYFQFNVGAAVRSPKVDDDLAERIMSTDAVNRILEAVSNPRDKILIRLFYASGGRVSELRTLCWRAVIPSKRNRGLQTGQILLRGKGEKNRNVLLTEPTWRVLTEYLELERSCGFGGPSDPVFRSRKGGALSRQQMWRIVKQAAKVAGLPNTVSPHWLRHAHASHALDEGAPVHLVKETLGHKSLATTSRYTHARPDDSSANYLDV